MTVNTVETVLHRLGNDRAMLESFHADPEAVLAPFPLSDEERRSILEWDLRAVIDIGVSPMVLMFAYTAAHGGPERSRSRYIEILNAPRRTPAA